jgi:hypothetical protein
MHDVGSREYEQDGRRDWFLIVQSRPELYMSHGGANGNAKEAQVRHGIRMEESNTGWTQHDSME